MADDVGDPLDRDPEQRHLDRGGQCGQVMGLDLDLDPGAVGQSAYVRGDRPDHTELVECWRAQGVDDGAQVGDGPAGRVLRPGEERERIAVALGELGAHRVEVEADTGQQRTEAVVQLAPQPTAFLLASLDDALAGGREVRGKCFGMHGGARLPGQLRQYGAVPLVQRCLAPSRRGHESADVRPPGTPAASGRARHCRAALRRTRPGPSRRRGARWRRAGSRNDSATVVTTVVSTVPGAATASRRRLRSLSAR
ncbi:hypothetical protein LP418_18660 [Nocardioides sp. B-3]|nr:hypothetical protein [Nocardioides sp. B-3]UUZ58255.1 hypothetical protein LP418_18660 [Nocardioides sp. B-3]